MDLDTALLSSSIGSRVRKGRQTRGWTLDQLADSASVSRRMLINVEQGSANPSVGTLLKISDALGVGLPALVDSVQPRGPKVTRHGDGAVLWSSPSGGAGILVAGTDPPDVVELWDWTLGPGDTHSSEAHAQGTKELVQVLHGSVRVEAGGESVVLKIGDAMSFPGDLEHSYANAGRSKARFSLAVYEPGVGAPDSNGAHQ